MPASEVAARRGDRLPGLDLLRAVAIAWVMIYHASLFGLAPEGPWVVEFGWMGVDLFFALSGYLIAGQLLRPWAQGGRPDYGRFFVRRLLRTLPAYLAVVAVYFLAPPLRDRMDIQPLWRFLTFTQNIGLDPHPPKAFSHAWSLCVEEQFYLLLPAVVALLGGRAGARRGVALFVGLFVALVGAGMALRGYFWLHDVARTPFQLDALPRAARYMKLIYYPTWTRLDDLLGGIALAALQAFRPQAWLRLTARPNMLLAAGAAGVLAASALFGGQIGGFAATVVGFPLIALSMALLVAAGVSPRSMIGRWKVPGAGALAAGAYSLYLSHKIVFHAVQAAAAAWPSDLQAAAPVVAGAGALAVGAGLYWAVERPFLRLRERWPRKAGPEITPASLADAA